MTKRIVRSWDVFDTLITRRCVYPSAIFDLMGAELGSDFTAHRIQAEARARASRREISLADIYDHLQQERNWSATERARALELELRTEFFNVIPITQNLSRVRDGDVLVSDMYLSEDVILALLRCAGLDKEVALFVSNHGKGDGTMWKRLRRQYLVLRHTGDNPRSDFLMPLRHAIPAGLTDAACETTWERLLRCNGAPALSAYVREMRLRAPGKSKAVRTLQAGQIEANFPLLLLASAWLVEWCTQRDVSRALMASRDCVLWAPLAERVARRAGSGLFVEYFLISRVAALKSSDDYLAYAVKRMTPDSVVVDLSMTGVSLAGLADRLGVPEVRAFVIAWHQHIAQSLYGGRIQPKARVVADSLWSEMAHCDLEAFNQALTPSIHDVVETNEGLSVVYAPENRPRPVLDAIRVQNDAFLQMMEGVPEAVLDEALTLARGARLPFLVRECERHAATFNTVVTRASPGAPLWNDPNGIKLGLPYTGRHPIWRGLTRTLKRCLKLVVRPGSSLYRYGAVPGLVVGAFRRSKS
jgi:hypothetical protein